MPHHDEPDTDSANRTNQPDFIQIGTQEAQAVVTLAGGCIAAYRLVSENNELDLLRPLTVSQAGAIDPLTSASFPLIPYPNRIKNGHFHFMDGSYQLPLNFDGHPHSIHGVGWQAPWHLTLQEDYQVTIELPYEGAEWPFAFHAVQVFTLNGATLHHELQITNTNKTPMPVGLGMHPYFPRHGQATLTADVDAVWLTDDTCLPIERVPCPDHWNLSAGANVDTLHCDNQFEPWSRCARIAWPGKKMSLELTASDDLDRLVVYAPAGEEFFCVEPVSQMTDAFNRSANGMPLETSGMQILEPGETWRVWMKLSPSAL